MEDLTEAVQRVAARAAAKYRRRVWWADVRDMEHEALVACLDAAKRYDPTYGLGPEPMLWVAAHRAIRSHLWRFSSPVTHKHRPREKLAGLHHEPLPESVPCAHNADCAAGASRLWSRLIELLGIDGARFATAVLVEGFTPDEIAQAHGVDVKGIYQIMSTLRTAMNDRVLWQMWEEGL